ncbi:MAG TPA: hypothetical protein VFV32_12840 [Acidimicrobiales bacterium]|jgi:hypothetical protein|nr:hypothetical protein [Acidimicrobiales bacterium]
MRLLHRDSTETTQRVDERDTDTGHRTDVVDLRDRDASYGPDDTLVTERRDTEVVDSVDRDRLDRTDTEREIDRDATTPAMIRERTWTFAPGQLVSLVAGGALAVVGAIALARAGMSTPLDSPVVDVLGWNHTAWLGIAELGLGAVLMLVGTGAWGRPLSVLLGAATVVAGVLVLAEAGSMPEELALEKSFGWPLIALGAVVALAAMALPVWRTNHTNVRTMDLRGEEHSRRHFWSRH